MPLTLAIKSHSIIEVNIDEEYKTFIIVQSLSRVSKELSPIYDKFQRSYSQDEDDTAKEIEYATDFITQVNHFTVIFLFYLFLFFFFFRNSGYFFRTLKSSRFMQLVNQYDGQHTRHA